MKPAPFPPSSSRRPRDRRPGPLRRFGRFTGRCLLTLAILLTSVWAVLALWYQLPLGNPGKVSSGVAWGLGALAALVLIWTGRAGFAVVGYGVAFAGLLGWWATIEPRDDRDWADDVSRHLTFQVHGDEVTIENIRDFDWHRDGPPTVRWETRRYDLKRLASVDLALSYWMGPAIAHTLVSFGFDDDHGQRDYLTFSVEIRKEKGEEFSAVAGFFKHFELALVAADERDILRVRTNVRDEDVYLYRIALPPAEARSLFLAYLDEAASLSARPRFYDTLTANCTTIVFAMAQRIVGGLPVDWRLLASGYLPEYLERIGGFASNEPLPLLRSAGRITDRAIAADRDPRFSDRIRDGIPGMAAGPAQPLGTGKPDRAGSPDGSREPDSAGSQRGPGDAVSPAGRPSPPGD